MRRRDYLRGLGVIAGIIGVAGCSSSTFEELVANPTAQDPAGTASDESRTERTAPASVTTRTADEPITSTA